MKIIIIASRKANLRSVVFVSGKREDLIGVAFVESGVGVSKSGLI
jgi:hypothetical protein